MKKSCMLFLALFALHFGYSQETKIEITNYERQWRRDDRTCNNDVRITVYMTDGSQRIIFDQNKDEATEGTTSDFTYTVDGFVNRIDIYQGGKDAVDELFGHTDCSRANYRDKETPLSIPLSCNSDSFYSNHQTDNFRQQVSFDYEITHLPEPEKTNTIQTTIGYEDSITLTATAGVNTSVYNWQYRVVGSSVNGNWTDLPGTNQRQPTVFINDLADESDIYKDIRFRIRPCGGYSSNFVNYTIKKSAPHIVGTTTSSTSCYEAEDGSVTIFLDKPIDVVNEEFGILITDPSRLEETIIGTFLPMQVALYEKEELLPFLRNGNTQITIPNLPPSRGVDFRVSYEADTEFYFSNSERHEGFFQIERNPPVTFTTELSMTPVFCHGGNDGSITLEAAGGTKSYEYWYDNTDNNANELPNERRWTAFDNALATTQTLTELTYGNYQIRIRDTNNCVAKAQTGDLDQDTGDIIFSNDDDIRTILVEQPASPLSLTYVLENTLDPTAFGFGNGQIQAIIKGGTPFESATGNPLYNLTWKDAAGSILTDVTNSTEIDGDGNPLMRSTLFNIPVGTYFVEVTDANHTEATYKQTCYINSTRSLDQPDPLVVNLRITNEISCNIENEYSNAVDFAAPLGVVDQFQDGAIFAEVIGGVPFDGSDEFDAACNENNQPYCYQWKKNINGSWVDLNTNQPFVENQSFGNYAFNVTDKNGISLGNYELIKNSDGVNEYQLSPAVDSLLYLPQPDKLNLSFEKTAVTCNEGNNAEATVFVTGGTPPYQYSWSSGATTAQITNLYARNYIVYITDAKGCEIEGSVTIEQPNGLLITPLIEKGPTCFEGNDGAISLDITGGIPPYDFQWNTGATTASLANLTQGYYSLQVTDSQECVAYFETTLVDPLPVVVNLGEDRWLCNNQSVILDIGINDPGASYQWSSDNGFSSTQASVEITQEGVYTATLTTGLGCVGTDQMSISVFDTEIDSDFLITSQAYTGQEVVLVNVSSPMGEQNIWTVPEGVEVLHESNEKLHMLFANPGAYELHLRAYQGNCYMDFTKVITVLDAPEGPEALSESQELIEEFICYPNPSDGMFKAKVNLTETANITLKLLDMVTGRVLKETADFSKQDFLVDFIATDLPNGLYFVLLETPKGSAIRKLIIE